MDSQDLVANLLTTLNNTEIRKTLGEIVPETVKNEIVLLRKELNSQSANTKKTSRSCIL